MFQKHFIREEGEKRDFIGYAMRCVKLLFFLAFPLKKEAEMEMERKLYS